MVELDLNRSRS